MNPEPKAYYEDGIRYDHPRHAMGQTIGEAIGTLGVPTTVVAAHTEETT